MTEGVRLLVGLIVVDGFGKDIFDRLVFGTTLTIRSLEEIMCVL